MLQKNLPLMQAIFVIFIRFWLDFIALLRFISEGKRKDALAVSKAHVNFFRNFRKNARKRTRTKSKKVSSGIYRASIIWAYFILQKQKFTELNNKKF